MKTTIRTGCPFLLQSVRRLLPAVVVVAVTLAGAAESKPAVAAEPKTHTLFMGADISVEYNKAMYRVQSVADGAVVINVGGKEVKVTVDWTKAKLKVDRLLKLTGTSATVINLKGERAYTPGNDPWENYQKGLVKAEVMHSESVFAQRITSDARAFAETAGVSSDPMGRGAAEHAKVLDQATARDNAAGNAGIGQGENPLRTGLELEGQETFDAMRLTFEVSAEPTLSDPYVVILGQYHEKNDKPDVVANWFYAQPIPAITSEAKKIKILAGGLPPGFEIDNFQVHLYNRGKEVATDVAPKRVPLTREEAHTYALIEYLSSNKGKSIPAKPFMGKLTKEARSQLSAGQWEQPYYVKVSKEGRALAAFLDTNCSRPVDAMVEPLIAHVRFYPALDKGKAIEGVAELKLGQLAL